MAIAILTKQQTRELEAAKAGRCPTCNYDLRATPDRCPECGTVISKDK